MIYVLTLLLMVAVIAAVLTWWRNLRSACTNLLRLPFDAVETLLGMGAKFACSAHHICGFPAHRIRRDLLNYSPLFRLVSIQQQDNLTAARLGNLITVKAQFHPHHGCSLYTGDCPKEITQGPTAVYQPPGRQSGKRLDPALQELLLEQLIQDEDDGLDTRALLVFQGNTIRAEAYGAGITASTRLLGWSMTKSLMALLYGRMETLGMTEPSTRDLFPEWADDARSEISLQHLLQMCDGLAFDEAYRPGADATRMLFGRQPASRYALERPLAHKPGKYFSYSSGSTNLLARWMHQRLGGTDAALSFWQEQFVAPLGLTNPLLEADGDGVFIGSSYGYATAEDWGRLGCVLVNKGHIPGGAQPFIDPHWIRRATRPNASENDPRYGYQLWLNTRTNQLPPLYPRLPGDSYFMLGNREQKLMIAPSQDAVIVRLGWSATPYPVEDRFGEILQALAEN